MAIQSQVSGFSKEFTLKPQQSQNEGLAIRTAVAWFVQHKTFDRGVPFYCNAERIGSFAVAPDALTACSDPTLFRLFITLSMYQALRDVVIMRQQKSLPRSAMRAVADVDFIRRSVAKNDCPTLLSADTFEAECNVSKLAGIVDCGRRPRMPCHVKDATVVFNRMGDMGKLPTSAWLRIWKRGGLRKILHRVCNLEISPTKRAALLVECFEDVYRVGRKLATMFVSALSTPVLADGLTPWFPHIDGNELVVIDTNVARAVDILGGPGVSRTYKGRTRWLCDQAALIDLRDFGAALPGYSPRFVQQALYAFCSKSNRIANNDQCALRSSSCKNCAPQICPFAE